MRKVIFLSYDGMTDPLGQSQVLPYLEGLTKRGINFHLISFEKPERFEQHHASIKQRCESNEITWHPLEYTKTPPVISTLKDIRRMYKTAKKIAKQEEIDLIHARSYISGIVAQKMLKRLNIPFVFDMRGFWADERVDGNIWDIKKPLYKYIYKYFKRKEIQLLKQAKSIISLTENAKNELLSWGILKGQQLNISVIPCCVDTKLFDPDKVNVHQKRNLKNALKIKEKDFVIGYIGSIGTWYMLDEMLDFFKVQFDTNPNVKMMFVTRENAKTIFKAAELRNIPKDRVIVVSTIHKYMPLHVSLFDFSIFFIKPSYSKKASSPTKQGELMAMGIPVICNAGVGDTDATVQNFNSGIVIPKLEKKSYAINLTEQTFDKTQIRNGAISFFELKKGVDSYFHAYGIKM